MKVKTSSALYLIAMSLGAFICLPKATAKEAPRASKSMPGALPTTTSPANGQLGARVFVTRESQNSSLGGPTGGALNSMPKAKVNQTNQTNQTNHIDPSLTNPLMGGKSN